MKVARLNGETLFVALSAIAVASMCLWYARAGWSAYFTGDDLMNLFQAWDQPLHKVLWENVVFFTPGYRPLGALVYRTVFWFAGLDALPFRIVCFALILFNLYLLYRVSAAVTCREAGLLSALFACYSASFVDLYHNTGTIYDLLCFTFYFLALDLYIRARERGENLRPARLALFLILYACALNSKEMAVTLPVVILLYEFILGRPRGLRAWKIGHGGFSRWAPLVLSAMMTVPFIAGKLSGPSPLVGNEYYRLHLSWKTYLTAMHHYSALLAGSQPDQVSPLAAIAALLMLLAAGAVAYQPSLLFLFLFVLMTPLPVAFVPLRNAFVMYIPAFGIASYVALVLVTLRERLWARLSGGGSGTGGEAHLAARFLTLGACVIALVSFHNSRPPVNQMSAESDLIRSTVREVARLQPKIAAGARILILDDPFAADEWTPVFILRLYSGIPDLVVDRVKTLPSKPDRSAMASYDVVLTFKGSRLIRVGPSAS